MKIKLIGRSRGSGAIPVMRSLGSVDNVFLMRVVVEEGLILANPA